MVAHRLRHGLPMTFLASVLYWAWHCDAIYAISTSQETCNLERLGAVLCPRRKGGYELDKTTAGEAPAGVPHLSACFIALSVLSLDVVQPCASGMPSLRPRLLWGHWVLRTSGICLCLCPPHCRHLPPPRTPSSPAQTEHAAAVSPVPTRRPAGAARPTATAATAMPTVVPAASLRLARAMPPHRQIRPCSRRRRRPWSG